MDIKYRDKHYFLTHELRRYGGRSEAIDFYDGISLETIEAFKKYYTKMPKDAKEHGFLYSEQQIKTFLTLAIGKITDCYFLQEHPIDRLKEPKKAKNNTTTVGHLDYWVNYKKSSFLIEVKHNWIRYYPEDNHFTFYKGLDDYLKHAVEQVDRIAHKTGFKYAQNLFGLGLIVAPVYIQDKAELLVDTPKIVLKNETISDLSDNAKRIGANIFSFWRIEQGFMYPNTFKNHKDIDVTQFYPGLAFIGRFKKISKNKKQND